MAVYFAKYGTAGGKEYQHRVPREWIDAYLVCDDCGRDYPEGRGECPDCGCLEAEVVEVGSAGRFWGYRGLRPVLAVREVTPDDGIRVGRVLRRWYRAKGHTKEVRRERVDQATGRTTYRATTVRKHLFAANRGFVIVNDAPAMASQLARYLGESRTSSKTDRPLTCLGKQTQPLIAWEQPFESSSGNMPEFVGARS